LYLSSQGDRQMSDPLATIRKLIDECSDEHRRALKLYLRKIAPHPLEHEWGIDADIILSAISRSSDLTKRGVRGIIAEAIFVNEVIPTVESSGWLPVELAGDHPYDATLKKGALAARIQVKLQRLQAGAPKLYYPKHYEKGTLFVVEVQKTRTGEKTTETITVNTRPYSFGDFDILAVNMHPSSGNWRNFRYTVASWLLPRPANESLVQIFQPVAAIPNEAWTDDLGTCLRWYESAKQTRVLAELLHLKKAGRKAHKKPARQKKLKWSES
jgi:hypothetical protein